MANSHYNVSIIIPCYRQAQWLPDAIGSALAQTVKCEVVVVDDGSPDNTAEVAAKFPGVRLIRQNNRGLSAARNTGIRWSTGKYIVTLDSDDMIDTTFVERCLEKINEGYDVVSTWLQTFGNDRRSWGSNVTEPRWEHFRQKNHINCCSMFSRKAWEKVGGYDEDMKEGFEDWYFWRKLSRAGYRFVIIPEYLFKYRKHGRSMFTEAKEKRTKLIDYMDRAESATGQLIDVVYTVGTGSPNDDQELRHSLRSLEKYMTGIRNVYVVGHRPNFINTSVKVIPMKDNGGTKGLNILNKLVRAAQISTLSEEFLYIHDDHFICGPCDAATYPNYYSESALDEVIMARKKNDPYRQMTCTTIDQVRDGQFKYYDIHRPIRMRKAEVIEMSRFVKFHQHPHGLLIKSTYMAYVDGTGIDCDDVIFRDKTDIETIRSKTAGVDCFSIHDTAVNEDMIQFMNEMYPVPSRWE